VPSVDRLEAAATAAREATTATHVDGARLANAAIACGVPVAALAAAADSVTLNLNKGLSAPMGALLCGEAAFVEAAREALGRIGAASVHQAGIWAAAGLLALEPAAIARLADDHAVARRLADGLAQLDGLAVRRVDTNIVLVDLSEPHGDARALAGALRRVGCGAYVSGPRQLRFVTHRHVGPADVDAVIEALASILVAP
jgi:threonine aldolase